LPLNHKPAAKPKDRDPVASGVRDAAYTARASFNYNALR